jgi:hypothetical protein
MLSTGLKLQLKQFIGEKAIPTVFNPNASKKNYQDLFNYLTKRAY